MNPTVHPARLTALMFLHFLGMGAIHPIMGYYLTVVLGFSGSEAGFITSTGAVAGLIAPFFMTLVTDRHISAARLYSATLLVSSIFLILIPLQRSFTDFFVVHFLFVFPAAMSAALVQPICFQQLGEPRRHLFGFVRVGATAGWITAALIVGYFWFASDGAAGRASLGNAFLFNGIVYAILAAYVFSLPPSAKEAVRPRLSALAGARALLSESRVRNLIWLGFLSNCIDQFFFFGGAPYLAALHVPEPWIMPALSLGQVSELGAMLALARFLAAWGPKRVLFIGAAAHLLRMALLSSGLSLAVVLTGVALHGIAFACFYTVICIQLDSAVDPRERSSAHLLFSAIAGGVGGIAGLNLAGMLYDAAGRSTVLSWNVGIAVALLMLAGVSRGAALSRRAGEESHRF